MLAHAGMTPARILDVATRGTAAFLKLADLGTLEPGKRADFIVLDANPLDEVANTQKIATVYARGVEIRKNRGGREDR